MAIKRVLLVSAGVTGLVLASIWLPGAATPPAPRIVRPMAVDEVSVASLAEIVRRHAASYKAGTTPKPSLYGKDLVSEKHAGARQEPGFNWQAGAWVASSFRRPLSAAVASHTSSWEVQLASSTAAHSAASTVIV